MVETLFAYAEWFAPYVPGFLDAAVVCMEVSFLAIVISWFIGLAATFAKESRSLVIRWPAEFYIWFVRGTPSLIQLFIVYYGIPHADTVGCALGVGEKKRIRRPCPL